MKQERRLKQRKRLRERKSNLRERKLILLNSLLKKNRPRQLLKRHLLRLWNNKDWHMRLK